LHLWMLVMQRLLMVVLVLLRLLLLHDRHRRPDCPRLRRWCWWLCCPSLPHGSIRRTKDGDGLRQSSRELPHTAVAARRALSVRARRALMSAQSRCNC